MNSQEELGQLLMILRETSELLGGPLMSLIFAPWRKLVAQVV